MEPALLPKEGSALGILKAQDVRFSVVRRLTYFAGCSRKVPCCSSQLEDASCNSLNQLLDKSKQLSLFLCSRDFMQDGKIMSG
jgi:hypothetical protein